MKNNRKVCFYNWTDWNKNVSSGNIGCLYSSQRKWKYISSEASADRWILAANQRNKTWYVIAWLRVVPRAGKPNPREGNEEFPVYYAHAESKLFANPQTAELRFIKEIDRILQDHSNSISGQGKAGYQFDEYPDHARRICEILDSEPGELLSNFIATSMERPLIGRTHGGASEGSIGDVSGLGKELKSVEELDGTRPLSTTFSSALSECLDHVEGLGSLHDLTEVEIETIVKQRIGHGALRRAVLKFYKSQCCITGLNIEPLLILSHIRPWSRCDKKEQKLDPENTLLLAANWDVVFDKGLVTFDESGAAVISDRLDSNALSALGIDKARRLPGKLLTEGRKEYLNFHREYVFRKH